MRQITAIDISEFRTADFIKFIFNREIPVLEDERSSCWYRNLRCKFDPVKVCGHLRALFETSGELLGRYSRAQLKMGFEALQSRTPGCSAREMIWDLQVPFEQRADCVRSMFHVFRDLFAVEPLEFTASMWWDVLCYDYETGHRKRSRGGDDLWMQEAMFETMFEILALDSQECRNAALHGLTHLHHPQTWAQLKQYESTLPFLDEAWYAKHNEAEARWMERIHDRHAGYATPVVARKVALSETSNS